MMVQIVDKLNFSNSRRFPAPDNLTGLSSPVIRQIYIAHYLDYLRSWKGPQNCAALEKAAY